MRRPARKSIKTGLQSLFEEHTQSVFSGMQGRLRERRDKHNRIIRVGRTLPFTLAEFRDWVRTQFKENVDSSIRCPHCKAILNVGSFVVDHDKALSQGGDIGLSNLVLMCAICNREKGTVSGKSWALFREWVIKNLSAAEASDIFGRLKNGGEGLKNRWIKQAEADKNKPRVVRLPTLFTRN